MKQTLTFNTLTAVTIAIVFALVFSFSASLALAHGGGGAHLVSPDSPSCMGELARLHANGKNPGGNPDTVKGFGTNQGHPGLGGPYDGSIQTQAKAFQYYCGIGK